MRTARMASLITLDQIPTLSLLYKSGRLHALTSSTSEASHDLNSKVSVIQADITKLQVGAIVNAANESLLGGGGVDAAIHRAAGRQLYEECRTLGGCKTGSAKITDAYKLPCEKVIHAVGPIYWSSKERGNHETLLQGCYRKALELAVENGVDSIAFSALSTGVYGYPSDEAADAAIREVKGFLEGEPGQHLSRVIFVTFERKDVVAYNRLLPEYFPPASADLGDHRPREDPQSGADLSTKSPPTASEAPTEQPIVKGSKIEEEWEQIGADVESAENGPAGS